MTRHARIALSGGFGVLLLALVASAYCTRTPGPYAAERLFLGRNSVGAAPRPSEKVVDALDPAAGAQSSLEQRKFGSTETLASLGRGANRTMVLDQQKTSLRRRFAAGHVPFRRPQRRQGGDLPL
jgi:hypothetical protein